MSDPKRDREKMKQEEHKKNRLGAAKDAEQRGKAGALTEMANSFSWLGMLIVIASLVGVFLLINLL
ncbi:DUF6366 family protein [Alkalicoccus chagannorensis]|uniref:DUF6366 family protein n=1 Tax=Alkalicoccus chagannorensis TaxID=427072 RepID=UPI000408BBC0|nr:DUF6366 family protein [Alkalicoccus chagannorensis]